MDRTQLMKELWMNYKKTNDLNFLIEACNNAPFFGNPEMGKEIAKLLSKNKKSTTKFVS